MLRIVLFGLWMCGVTAASAYAAIAFSFAGPARHAGPAAGGQVFVGGLKYQTTPVISVPAIADGKVQGYIVAQFVYTVDGGTLEKLAVPPDAFIADAAFRRLFSDPAIDFHHLKAFDPAPLVASIRKTVNDRLQAPVLHDLLLHELNFVDRADIRE